MDRFVRKSNCDSFDALGKSSSFSFLRLKQTIASNLYLLVFSYQNAQLIFMTTMLFCWAFYTFRPLIYLLLL